MKNILRSIVAGPRARHPEANLDLCYVTDKIIATSGPSATYPSLAYRNPLDQLVKFLDSRHQEDWCIWEFRAEGCGYPDEEVYNRIWHFPWPDHHPPPFALVPKIMASMRNWLHEEPGGYRDKGGRVIVVHCKAGKGRSGTMAISYLITHESWTKEDALQRFTDRRMRPGFGAGISIPSQLRWINYVERWAGHGGRMYVERPVEVTEVHVWGLRDGVKIVVEGYVESGRKIKAFHVFSDAERDDTGFVKGPVQKGLSDMVQSVLISRQLKRSSTVVDSPTELSAEKAADRESDTPTTPVGTKSPSENLTNTIFRPSSRIILPSSDINLATERRSGWNTVTSVAHVWFNCFFEGSGPENFAKCKESSTSAEGAITDDGSPWAESSGVFEIDWEKMDGIKGSSRKGIRAFDRVAVVWKVVEDETSETNNQEAVTPGTTHRKPSSNSLVIPEPGLGESVSPVEAADWRGDVPVATSDDHAAATTAQGVNVREGKWNGQKGIAEEEAENGKPPVEGGGDGEGSDSEDGAAGIRRGISTEED